MNARIYIFLRFIKRELVVYPYCFVRNAVLRLSLPKIRVASIEETIYEIIEKKRSVSRFGDGEYFIMIGVKQGTFQESPSVLGMRLREVLSSSYPGHIVCISDIFGSLGRYNRFAKHYSMEFMSHHRRGWTRLLDPQRLYYNAFITRLYMDYRDKSRCGMRFELIKKIWKDRDVIIIEGDKTRLGVGNDLFDGAKSIRRILAPAVNAYEKYDEILLKACEMDKSVLFLIALGATATILAYDLAVDGYQAIDVGHVDIEYEWFRMGAKSKLPIKNKYVNEAAQIGGIDVADISDIKYHSEIISTIV